VFAHTKEYKSKATRLKTAVSYKKNPQKTAVSFFGSKQAYRQIKNENRLKSKNPKKIIYNF
jgi:hypothetical protein